MFEAKKDDTRKCAVCGKLLKDHYGRACNIKEADDNEEI